MGGVRRALLFASAERYICLALNFAAIALVSRLLTPTEVGTSAIGLALITIAIALREFAACGFLVQGAEVNQDDVRTAFTIQFIMTFALASLIVLSADSFADFYGEPRLADFVRIVSLGLVAETFSAPTLSLLRRALEFGTLAIINILALCVNSSVTIVLALAGFGFMSVGWAWLASALTTVLLTLTMRPNLQTFRFSLASWRRAVAFGSYNGAMTTLARVFETLPQLVLGRVLSLQTVGLYNRSVTVAGIPDKFIFAGVFNVAFPALAAEFRSGRSLKDPLLQAFRLIVVFHWPAMIAIAVLADPIVRLILGEQWGEVVLPVQIMALASLALFPVVLAQPLLMAVGAMRDAFLINLIVLPISALVLCGASSFGIVAMAASQFLIIPFQAYISLRYVRRHVHFEWLEMVAALRDSAAVTCFMVLPILLLFVVIGFRLDLSFGTAALAACLSAAGWLLGVRVTRHPIGDEIRRVAAAVERRLAGSRVPGTRWSSVQAED